MVSSVKDRGNAILDFYHADGEVEIGDLPWENPEAFAMEVEHNATSFTGMLHNGPVHGTDLGKDQVSPSTGDLFGLLRDVQRVADIVSSSLGVFTPHRWKFKHGPGAVADKVPRSSTSKYSFRNWSDRLESFFPYADFAVANYACVEEESVEELLSRGFFEEPPAKLYAVPKTLKTPRLIASEPTAHQWCQQAVREFLYSRVRRSFMDQFISFDDQTINGQLALEASHGQTHSTIDLKSASDYISCRHVERLFRRSPTLLHALHACRSTELKQDLCVKSPKTYRIRKFTTMGNACTFPVQSIFFAVLAIASVLNTRKQRVSMKNIRLLGRRTVRVFGDDVIVPADCTEALLGLMSHLNLRVNTLKTFKTGSFRESCGIDAFDGVDVSSVSITMCPSRTSPSSIVSCVEVHNNLLSAGYLQTASYIRKTASFPGLNKVRETKHGDGAFGWNVFGAPSFAGFRLRVNKALQRLEVLCLQQTTVEKRAPAEGYPALLQYFTEAAKEVTSAKSTLGHLTRRPKVRLGLRWAPV
jgi:hypothetical protein